MRCERCQGKTGRFDCPDCAGSGVSYCCDTAGSNQPNCWPLKGSDGLYEPIDIHKEPSK